MNNVILAIWLKGQDLFEEPPQIIYAYWITLDDKSLIIYPNDGTSETIPLDIIGFMSVVGQYGKAGLEYRHHDDPKPLFVEC